MPFWHSYLDGRTVTIVHSQPEEGQPVGRWDVEIHRGTPSATDHPEIEHAFMGIHNPEVHKDFIRHSWEWEIPDVHAGYRNSGAGRRYMILRASGGPMNWTLELKFPPLTPPYVFAAVARGFHARPKQIQAPAPARRRKRAA